MTVSLDTLEMASIAINLAVVSIDKRDVDGNLAKLRSKYMTSLHEINNLILEINEVSS